MRQKYEKDELLTVAQAAGEVPWDERTLWRWIEKKKIPVYRTPGGAPRVKLCDLDPKPVDPS